MTTKNISLLSVVFLFALLYIYVTEAKAQSQQSNPSEEELYLPVGPQTNVPVDTVINGGWTECYRDIYDNDVDIDSVLEQCPGDRLMLACRQTDSSTLTLLAQGERSDVTFDTGENLGETRIADGVGWYFNIGPNENASSDGQNAWGFVRAGDSVEKINCDVDQSGANNERLCWHLQIDTGGYRCGVVEDLNTGGGESENYERIVYIPAPIVTSQVPTLSEWGLIAMAGLLGFIGFMVIRRRKAAA